MYCICMGSLRLQVQEILCLGLEQGASQSDSWTVGCAELESLRKTTGAAVGISSRSQEAVSDCHARSVVMLSTSRVTIQKKEIRRSQ